MTIADDGCLERAANLVANARKIRQTIPPLPFHLSEPDAYAVQRINVDKAVSAGAERAGYKIGLTSEAVRRQLGANQPDFGILFREGQVVSSIDVDALLQPRIEAEIALVLSSDLPANLDPEDVPRFVAYASAAAEIVDSVFEGWDLNVAGAIADNGCAAAFALGARRVSIESFDRTGAEMTMWRNGELASSGSGAATMGDPFAALAWLAWEATGHGEMPKAGDVVLTGALGPMTELIAQSTYTIHIEGLGGLSLSAAGSA